MHDPELNATPDRIVAPAAYPPRPLPGFRGWQAALLLTPEAQHDDGPGRNLTRSMLKYPARRADRDDETAAWAADFTRDAQTRGTTGTSSAPAKTISRIRTTCVQVPLEEPLGIRIKVELRKVDGLRFARFKLIDEVQADSREEALIASALRQCRITSGNNVGMFRNLVETADGGTASRVGGADVPVVVIEDFTNALSRKGFEVS